MALVASKAEPPRSGEAFPDADRDGWDDNWVEKYPGAKLDAHSDPDGDCVPNSIEMMVNQDPFTREPVVPSIVDRHAVANSKKKQREIRKRNRQALAPYVIDCLRDPEGNPTTREARKERKLEKSRRVRAEVELRRPAQAAAREARLIAYLETTGKNLPDEVKASLQDVIDGEPRFIAPLGHIQARTNHVLNLSDQNNYRDNVEVIDVTSGSGGEYTVQITAEASLYNGDPQPVSIIISGEAEAIIPSFRIITISPTNAANPGIYNITWASEPGRAYEIESSPDLDSWLTEPGEYVAIGDITSAELDMSTFGDRYFVRIRSID